MKAKAIWLTVMGGIFAASLLLLTLHARSAEVFPLDALLTPLQRAGYEVRTDTASSEFLSGRATQITLFGNPEQTILLYQYLNTEKAREDASCIDSSGCLFTYPEENGTERSITVEWVDSPHFYSQRNAILQYVGSDEKILSVLESLCGPPFAGAGRKDASASQALTLESTL